MKCIAQDPESASGTGTIEYPDHSYNRNGYCGVCGTPAPKVCRVCDATRWVTDERQEGGEIVTKSCRCPICQIPSEPVS
jgi:hypothetical protein